MRLVQPEELSGLLDGELEPERAREVEMQIATDPMLRAEFEAMSETDAIWRASAGAAAFSPDVALPADARGAGWLAVLAVSIGGLIVTRIILKLAGSNALAFGLPAISLMLLLAAVVGLARMERRAIPDLPA